MATSSEVRAASHATRVVNAHRACVTSTGGGLLLDGGGVRSFINRVSDTTCLLNRGLPLPSPRPCSTCAPITAWVSMSEQHWIIELQNSKGSFVTRSTDSRPQTRRQGVPAGGLHTRFRTLKCQYGLLIHMTGRAWKRSRAPTGVPLRK